MSKTRDLINDFLQCTNLTDRIDLANQLLKKVRVNSTSQMKFDSFDQAFINELWELLKPDNIKRRNGVDESRNILEAHSVSTQLLEALATINVGRHHFRQENISLLKELLSLKDSELHSRCCGNALDVRWAHNSIKKAKSLMTGKVFKAIMELNGAAYYAEFQTIDTQQNVTNIIAQEIEVQMNNLSFNLSTQTSTETIKVVHVVNPEFLWVQELTDDISLLSVILEEHMSTCPQLACPGDSNVVINHKKMFLRAKILSWSAETATVSAVDYGWEIEIERELIFKSEDHIAEIPPLAKLCRLINISPPSKVLIIQKSTIRLLQHLTKNRDLVEMIIKLDILSNIVKIIESSRNSSLICDALLFISQCSYHHNSRSIVGKAVISSLVKCLEQWSFCFEVQAIGFECCRNLLYYSRSNQHTFIFNKGLELILSAYGAYKNDDIFTEHMLHILKLCLNDLKFDSPLNRCLGKNAEIECHPKGHENVYSHLSNIFQYQSEFNKNLSFVNDINTHEELVVFAREVVSHLNSSGGTMFIGVTHQGLISAIQLNRSRKDEYRTKLDMVFLKMIADINLMELPEQLFDCSFHKVINSHGRAMSSDTTMYVIKVLIKGSKRLCRLKDGENSVFVRRLHGSVVPLSANELRQHCTQLSSPDHSTIDNCQRQEKGDVDDPMPRILQARGQLDLFRVPDLFSLNQEEKQCSDRKVSPITSGPPPLVLAVKAKNRN